MLKELVCWWRASCLGEVVGHNRGMDHEECLQFCKEVEECQWLTYDPYNNYYCQLRNDCELITNSTSITQFSAQKACSVSGELGKDFYYCTFLV